MFKRNTTPTETQQPVQAVERITSVLGSGVIWHGSINGVRIEGAFEGEIALRGMLVVGETGRVTCQNVRANTVIVAGAVRGNITTQKLEIRSSGRVWGDVVTTAFVTEEGAFLRGQIRMEETVELDLEPAPETTPSEAAQAESIASTPIVMPDQLSEGTTRKIPRKK
jgi:cytoskeletal protein CcmA (bactofilin family)